MADDMDYVQTAVDAGARHALTLHQQQREADDNPGIDCIDCDDEIPLKRRQIKPGCRRCINCQNVFEKQVLRRVH